MKFRGSSCIFDFRLKTFNFIIILVLWSLGSETQFSKRKIQRRTMTVSTIALYASPPSSVCSTPHPCHINAHASYDFDLGSRSSSSSSSTTASTSQKPVMSGLSCLFSSPTVKHAPLSSFSGAGEELGCLAELKELSSSFSYSPSKFSGSSWKRDQSPVSVFQGPVSCSSSSVSGSARSPPVRIGCDSSIRCGNSGLLDGFVRNALGSCLDYDSPGFEIRGADLDVGSPSSSLVDELTFNLEDAFVEGTFEPYARELLAGAQLRHKIFCEEFVIKAFCEAEKAHRGQVTRGVELLCCVI